MRSIEINFHHNIKPEQQKAVLDKINRWDSIEAAGHIMPDSSDENIKRMAFAYVKDDAKIEAVSKQLEELPEIETASIPPERYL